MKRALIIIDMQTDFVDGTLANPMAQAIVNEIAEYAQNFDGDLIATRDTHAKNYLETSEGKRLPITHCVHGTSGWEIVPQIQQVLNEKGATILDKPTFGYLHWELLQAYDEVVMVGTCTDICVVSNALVLKAKFPDLVLKVKGDLCAGTTQENHEAALQVMACCQVDII